MTSPLPLLTDLQVQQSVPTDDSGFGSLATERGNLPLVAMDVQARIDGLLGEVDVRQTFANTFSEPLEATYIFPLPDRAAVTRFRMEVAGRVIEGVLQERAQARNEYEQAIQAGHRAAITEEERPNVFTLRVGNLMPGEQATVRLTLVGPLPTSDGEATFRFPLVVAPRYIPGSPLPGPSVGDGTAPDTGAVPDASRITPPVLLPGYPNPVRLSLTVEVRSAGLPLGDFRSSLHAVLTEEGPVRRIRLQPGERLDRDFILRFRLGEETIKTALILTPDKDGKEGTFALTIVPPISSTGARQPRDVVFVLDRSGSMGGWKIVAARRALARMVDTLSDQDRFSILAFDNAIETVPEWSGVGLVAASDRNRFRAVEFLSKLDARGGTEMARPLDLAVRQLAGDEAKQERILVLITDGQVGNEDQILRSLVPHVRNLRIFTLGIDQAVNEGFLHRLATLAGGMSEVVESEDRLDEVMDKIHRRIGTPVLTGLHLEPAGLRFDPETIVPARMPDLFAGVPLCILGRYRGAAKGALAVQARDSAGKAWGETLAATASDNSAIASVWARGHIRELEDRFACGTGDRANLEKRIIGTSLQFNVLSRFTAFVAVDRSEVVNQGGQVQRIMQPVEAPAGWAMFGTDVCMQSIQMAECLQRAIRIYNATPQTYPAEGSRSIDETLMDDDATTPEAGTTMMQQRFRGVSVQSPLETYLGEINETSLLSAEEEKLLALRIEQGDIEACDHLVRANLRLVVNIARSYTGKGLGLQDLIAEGNLGLMRAVEGFDPSMNTRFSTYASYWIKQSIKRAVINTGKTIRIPAYMNELLVNWRRATAKLQDKLGRNPTNEEVVASLNLPKKKLSIIKKAIRIYNASPQTHPTEGGRSIDETLMDDDTSTPETNIVKEEDLQQVMDLLSKLDKREAAVLRLRFGLDGEDPKTLKEIGECLGLTRERVRQIESEALNKLSESVQAESRRPAPPPPPPPPDLSSYRRRAQELLEDLQKQTGKDASTELRELGSLSVKLEALIKDLKSMGAKGAEIRPLSALLRKLKALLSARRPKHTTIAAAWSQSEAVLRAFAQSSESRRASFWK